MYTGRSLLRRVFNPVVQANAPAQARLHARLQVNDDWTIADYLRRADGGAEILFEAEEIESTAEEMLGPVWTYRVEEPGEGESSAAAEMQSQKPMLALMPTLRNLLNNPEVHRACMVALQQDVNFQQVMRLGHTAAPTAAPLALTWTPEWTPEEPVEAPGIQRLLSTLGSRLVAAGQAALHTAAGFRNALGRFLIQCGANLHAILGQPFSTAPLDEAMREEDEDVRAEQVGQALITVAIAILGIVFLKRAHLVTTI